MKHKSQMSGQTSVHNINVVILVVGAFSHSRGVLELKFHQGRVRLVEVLKRLPAKNSK